MKFLKEIKDIGFGILAFLVVFGILKLAKVTLEPWQGVIVLLLILIYFELIELTEKKK